jgi:very-short-patch-repair endonuclease/endogenous inhibitor of DNA gyrase (YacG/DUF329 family)
MAKNITLTCKQCGHSFSVEGQRGKRTFCSRECLHASRRGRKPANALPVILRECLHCGAEFKADRTAIARGHARYCSATCARKATGLERVKPLVALTCPECGQTKMLRTADAAARTYCSHACSSKARKRTRGEAHPLYRGLAERTCEWCGAPFKCKPAKVAYGEGRFCSRACKGSYTISLQQGRRSSLEVLLEGALRVLGEPFVAQKPMAHWSVDFYLPRLKLAVECDGSYWHSLPDRVAKDERKDGWLRSHGQKVVRLSEAEIKADPMAAALRAIEHGEG